MANADIYRDAGVDQGLAGALSGMLKERVSPGIATLAGIGSFAAAMELPKGMQDPVVTTCCDGIGTKTILLRKAGRLDVAGQDLVASCLNDLACMGGRPWQFLDYYGCASLDEKEAKEVLLSIAKCCEDMGCELAGGEIAQMPGVINNGEMELVGFAAGLVEKKELLGPERPEAGDVVLGISANGLHCNGYTLVRRVMDDSGIGLDDMVGELSLADILLKPTPCYSPVVAALQQAGVGLRSCANITGGGVAKNLARALPKKLGAKLERSAWRLDIAHEWLCKAAGIDDSTLLQITNGGLGMAFVVSEKDSDSAMEILGGFDAACFRIGEVDGSGEIAIA